MSDNLIHLIEIPKIVDDCFLCFAESRKQIPFMIKRIYFIGKAVPGLPRGKHAHKKNRQVLFCLQGKVKMLLDNGKTREEIILDRPEAGILLDRMIWHEMLEMDEKTILMIVASDYYNESDYIRSYSEFKKSVKVSQ